MSFRDVLNKNPAAVTVGVVVVLALALGLIIMQSRSRVGAGPTDAYYYDMNTGKIFLGPSVELAPIETDSGSYKGEPAGVKASIFTCGGCANFDGMTADQLEAHDAWIGWLEQYTPQAKQQFTEFGHTTTTLMMKTGVVVKRVDDEHWVAYNSPPAMALIEESNRCPDGEITMCQPGH